jgi:hypothetical protein
MNEMDSIQRRLARLEAQDLGGVGGTQEYTEEFISSPLNLTSTDPVTDIPGLSITKTLTNGVTYRWSFQFQFWTAVEGQADIYITDDSNNILAGWAGKTFSGSLPITGIIQYVETGTGASVIRKCRAEIITAGDLDFTGDEEAAIFSVERTG